MRTITAESVTALVAKLCQDANIVADAQIAAAIGAAIERERSERAKSVLKMIRENINVAACERMPLCQDTGMVVVFADIGERVYAPFDMTGAINEGVRRGYKEGHLRASVVADPIERVNTGDNTPAIIYYDRIPGDSVTLTVVPKGFGSENKGRTTMLNPSDGIDGVINFVVESVKLAGSDPCPPIIVGVGVGGTMDKAALLAKRATILDMNGKNANPMWSEAERRMLKLINDTNIGPAGMGGETTALVVHVLTYPTHIAGLPVAVNIGCHVTRHRTGVI